jgi:hypothetical protein
MSYAGVMIRRSMRGEVVLSLLLLILQKMLWSSGRADTRGETPLLQIGQEDGSYSEFAGKGFRDL